MYLLLESTNWIHFYNEAGHVSTHGNVYSLNPCLTDGEWLCPPPGTISNKTSMQLQTKKQHNPFSQQSSGFFNDTGEELWLAIPVDQPYGSSRNNPCSCC